MKKFAAFSVAVVVAGLVAVWSVQAAEEKAAPEVTVKGEVLDMACYLDHGAKGEKHAQCASTCISSGLPVGLKGSDGKTYLLIGDHKPLNSTLADQPGKTISIKGKLVSRDGINMIETPKS